MDNYIKIDAILNWVSGYVKENYDTPQILSWANQAIRDIRLPIRYNTQYALIEVKNHKATLPDGIKKLLFVGYTDAPLPETMFDIVVEMDNVDRTVMLQQQLLFSNPWYDTLRPLYYLGQNKAALIDNGLYCNNCGQGFSIDHTLKCLTVDIEDTTLCIAYEELLKDEDCNILIPDDSFLLRGLADFASAQCYKELWERNSQGAYDKYMSFMQTSQTMLNKYKGSVKMKKIKPSLHENFLKLRNNMPGMYDKYYRNFPYRGNKLQ